MNKKIKIALIIIMIVLLLGFIFYILNLKYKWIGNSEDNNLNKIENTQNEYINDGYKFTIMNDIDTKKDLFFDYEIEYFKGNTSLEISSSCVSEYDTQVRFYIEDNKLVMDAGDNTEKYYIDINNPKYIQEYYSSCDCSDNVLVVLTEEGNIYEVSVYNAYDEDLTKWEENIISSFNKKETNNTYIQLGTIKNDIVGDTCSSYDLVGKTEDNKEIDINKEISIESYKPYYLFINYYSTKDDDFNGIFINNNRTIQLAKGNKKEYEYSSNLPYLIANDKKIIFKDYINSHSNTYLIDDDNSIYKLESIKDYNDLSLFSNKKVYSYGEKNEENSFSFIVIYNDGSYQKLK